MNMHARSYLDHNASAPLIPAARAAMAEVLEMTGNPSSVHAEGRALRETIETARDEVARTAGTRAERVVFTGSATEAIAQAIIGAVNAGKADRIVTSGGEHQAVLSAAESAGAPASAVPLTADGLIDLDALEALLGVAGAAGKRALVAVHQVNNETGVIQPLEAIAGLVGEGPHLLFVDAVQGFGKLPTDFDADGADMVAVSAHKIGGPTGIGALIVGEACDDVRLIPGGGQQQNRRGGTESAALSAGFGVAARDSAIIYDLSALRSLTHSIEAAIVERAPDAVIFGLGAERLGTTVDFALPGLANATAMIGFDLGGVALSAGSACSSGKVAKSHVLKAMGVADRLADCALRVSVGWTTTDADIERFAGALDTVLARRVVAA